MPKARAHLIAPAILQRARDFRHPLTPPEAKVWQAVRKRQLGFKIRRQHPIGRFIADFYCAEARLVIEIDGGVHADPDQAANDEARTGCFEESGYRVLRFQAREVDKELRAVVQAIHEGCEVRRRLEELGYFKVPREG